MWFELLGAAMVCVFTLYAAGYCILRIVKTSRLFSAACAPLVSIPLWCCFGIVYSSLGVSASFWSVVLLPTAIGVGTLLIVSVSRIKKKQSSILAALRHWDSRRNACTVVLYGVVGVALGTYVLLMGLDGADSVIQTYDNMYHYDLMRAFADSGEWSLLSCSVYASSSSDATPLLGAGYYPAAWHLVGAAAISFLGVSVGIASNALNFVFTALVFPLSMWALLYAIFGKRKSSVVTFGAFASLSVAAFPWELMVYWPLYPNSFSMALLPALCACFIEIFKSRITRNCRLVLSGIFLLGIAALACVQPNSVFTAAVFLAPFYAWVVWEIGKQASWPSPYRTCCQIVLLLATVLIMLAIWYALYCLPAFSGVVNYYWEPLLNIGQSIKSVLLAQFLGESPQVIIAITIALGAVYLILFARRWVWLVFSYLFACFIYVVSSSMGDIPLKHIVSGFWYTDPYRTASIAGLCAIPLVAIGLYAFTRFMLQLVNAIGANSGSRRENVLSAFSAGVFSLLVFFPAVLFGSETFDTSFASLKAISAGQNSVMAENPYSHAEAEFVEKVKDIIDAESIVLNEPYDGSMIAYGLSGLNVYYRSIDGYGGEAETDNGALIRNKLVEVASNSSVRQACKEVGAAFVLLLDYDRGADDEVKIPNYVSNQWVGIDSITDDTSGFEIVLAEGDMRLYRISAVG